MGGVKEVLVLYQHTSQCVLQWAGSCDWHNSLYWWYWLPVGYVPHNCKLESHLWCVTRVFECFDFGNQVWAKSSTRLQSVILCLRWERKHCYCIRLSLLFVLQIVVCLYNVWFCKAHDLWRSQHGHLLYMEWSPTTRRAFLSSKFVMETLHLSIPLIEVRLEPYCSLLVRDLWTH